MSNNVYSFSEQLSSFLISGLIQSSTHQVQVSLQGFYSHCRSVYQEVFVTFVFNTWQISFKDNFCVSVSDLVSQVIPKMPVFFSGTLKF